MKAGARVAAMWLAILLPLPCQENPDIGRKIYADNARSVLLLYVQSSSGEFVALGSGFWIPGNRIITNAHIANAGKLFLELGPARVPARVEKIDSFNDLAVLIVEVEITVRPLALASKAPVPGDTIFTIGNPEGLERTISQGVVSGVRELDGRQLIQITAPISPGSSGGPVLNASGEVVAVTVGTLTSGQNLNFAAPISLVTKLLRGGSVGTGDSVATLAEVEHLRTARNNEPYSDDPGSGWQLKQKQINTLLRKAFEEAGTNSPLLARISEEALYEDVDISIEAARRSVETKPSAKAQTALAKGLQFKAYAFEGKNKQALLSGAEKAARAALVVSDSPSAEAYYTLGDILEDEESYAEAERNLRLALRATQGSPNAALQTLVLRTLARVASALQKPAEAQQWFDRLVSTGTATALDWSTQGRRLRSFGKAQEAASAYETAAQLGGGYRNWCDASYMYYLVGQDDSNLSAARKCIEDGTGRDNSENELAAAHIQIAEVLNKRGVYAEALTHAKEATVLNSTLSGAFDAMAVALLGLRRFQEAANASRQAIRLSDGRFAWMHFHLGAAYFELENWEFARQSYEKAAELNPTEAAAAYNVALCHQRLGYYSDAAKWYEEYLRRNPNGADKADILERIRIFKNR